MERIDLQNEIRFSLQDDGTVTIVEYGSGNRRNIKASGTIDDKLYKIDKTCQN